MKKRSILFLAALFTGLFLSAQSVEDAKSNLFNGRSASAKQILEKLLSSNDKNAEAIYWLGQSHLAVDDIAGAKKIYQNALNGGINNPLIIVGMGHIALLEGNKADARQRFDVAIATSMIKKKENPVILNAIGRANADGGANVGDQAYAIEKLKKATELDPNNDDVFINLGINYIKLNDGTNAYEAYNNALRANPKSARAYFRLAKLFQSQGNKEKFLEYYNNAIAANPDFAPAYLELYDYYSNRDVNKAGDYLQKYVANSDPDCNTEFLYADYLFRSGKYQLSLDKTRAMENGACKNFPRLKVLYAYNYDRLGDSMQAKSNIQSYMNTASPDKIQSSDYLFAASIMKKSVGGEDAAIGYLKKALDNDTVKSNRKQYIDTIAMLYKKAGKANERLQWLKMSYALNPNPNNLDMYNVADAAIATGNYALADSMANKYIQKYPDQEYGYALKIRGAKASDTTGAASFPAILQYIDFLNRKDAAANAQKIVSQYTFIASTAADRLKNYAMALDAVNKIIAIDPANNFATQAKPVLEKAVKGGGGTPKKPAAPAKKGK